MLGGSCKIRDGWGVSEDKEGGSRKMCTSGKAYSKTQCKVDHYCVCLPVCHIVLLTPDGVELWEQQFWLLMPVCLTTNFALPILLPHYPVIWTVSTKPSPSLPWETTYIPSCVHTNITFLLQVPYSCSYSFVAPYWIVVVVRVDEEKSILSLHLSVGQCNRTAVLNVCQIAYDPVSSFLPALWLTLTPPFLPPFLPFSHLLFLIFCHFISTGFEGADLLSHLPLVDQKKNNWVPF